MSSIFANPGAYSPFYTDIVSVRGQRGGRSFSTGAVKACVLSCGFDDPLAGSGDDVSRRRFTVEIRIADWPESSPPRTGDTVTVFEPPANGAPAEKLHTLAVCSVRRAWYTYVMEARE